MVYRRPSTATVRLAGNASRGSVLGPAYTSSMRIGLLPSAGTASRMNGIPKFLLPVSEKLQCLLDYHVQLMAPTVERIIIPTRSEWVELLRSFNFGSEVDIVELNTATMAETLRSALAGVDYDSCVLGMPDTYFVDDNPYAQLASKPAADMSLWLFPTRPEQEGKVGSVKVSDEGVVVEHADKEPARSFGWHWGVMEFAKATEEFLDPRASTGGYLIDECLNRSLDIRGYKAEHPYFDCGTFPEYLQALSFVSMRGD